MSEVSEDTRTIHSFIDRLKGGGEDLREITRRAEYMLERLEGPEPEDSSTTGEDNSEPQSHNAHIERGLNEIQRTIDRLRHAITRLESHV